MPSIELSNLSIQETQDLLENLTKNPERDKEDEKINHFTEEEKRSILLEAAKQKEEGEAQVKKSFIVRFANGLSKLFWGNIFFFGYLYLCFCIAMPSLNDGLTQIKVNQFYKKRNNYYQMKNRQAIYNLCVSEAKTAFDAAKPGSLQAYLAEKKRIDCGDIVNGEFLIPLWELDKYNDFYELDKTTIDNAKQAGRAILSDMGISPSTNAKLGQILFVLKQQLNEKAKKINMEAI